MVVTARKTQPSGFFRLAQQFGQNCGFAITGDGLAREHIGIAAVEQLQALSVKIREIRGRHPVIAGVLRAIVQHGAIRTHACGDERILAALRILTDELVPCLARKVSTRPGRFWPRLRNSTSKW